MPDHKEAWSGICAFRERFTLAGTEGKFGLYPGPTPDGRGKGTHPPQECVQASWDLVKTAHEDKEDIEEVTAN